MYVDRHGDRIWGAPAIDQKRPYGSSSGEPAYHVYKILGGPQNAYNEHGDLPDADLALCRRLHAETWTALQVVLAAGSFEPGLYVADPYSSNWRRADD